jgi:hypothetical protein
MFSDHRKQRAGVAKIPSDGEELFVTKNPSCTQFFILVGGFEPRAREAGRQSERPSGGQGSEIFYDGELCEPEIKYETRVTESSTGHKFQPSLHNFSIYKPF